MPYFRKKPLKIEAVQLCWKNWNEICDFVPREIRPEEHVTYCSECNDACGESPEYIKMKLLTPEGLMGVKHGDWIIKGLHGECYSHKAQWFFDAHEPCSD